jgi:signal transduction histidine kinase
VRLDLESDRFVIETANTDTEATMEEFTPRSISERVRALGGSVQVRRDVAGSTIVSIEVPL